MSLNLALLLPGSVTLNSFIDFLGLSLFVSKMKLLSTYHKVVVQ